MRTTPLVGRKAWFGPRRIGWGLIPVSPEGWVVVAVAVVLALVLGVYAKHQRWLAVIPIVVLLIIVMFLKGAAPGGPRAREEFDAEQSERYRG